MNMTDQALKQFEDPTQTPDQRVLLRCRRAAEFIHTGRYESAREVLGDLWHDIGMRPVVPGLAILTVAEVFLQCGTLSGWLGNVHQISGAQEKAKELLGESLRLFESQGHDSKVSEALYELGICYWRAGGFDEARVVLGEALTGLGEQDGELKAKILIRRTLVEISENRYHDAWDVLKEAQPLFESCSDALKGRWHGQLALVLRRLSTAEERADYADRAIMEYTAAIYHFEQAGHERYCATNLNNLAFLLYKLGRYEQAHEHLDRVISLLMRLRDDGLMAQVNETRARVYVAQQRYAEADRTITRVIQTLEHGGESALLADALSIQGAVWAGLGIYDKSIDILLRAVDVAQDAGAFSNAGLAALTLIEEHGAKRLSDSELYGLYLRADQLLKGTQDADDIARLRACARIVAQRSSGTMLLSDGFSLPRAMHDYEARFIKQALEMEKGSVTRAARRLGLKHQSLALMLGTRHQQFLSLRTPVVPRRRSIITIPKETRR